MKILIAVRDYDKNLYRDIYDKIISWGNEIYIYKVSDNILDYDAMLFLEHYKDVLDDFYGVYQMCKKCGILTLEEDMIDLLCTYKIKLRDLLSIIKGDVIIVNEKNEEVLRSKEGKVSVSEVANIVNWTVINCSIQDNKHKIVIGRT